MMSIYPANRDVNFFLQGFSIVKLLFFPFVTSIIWGGILKLSTYLVACQTFTHLSHAFSSCLNQY